MRRGLVLPMTNKTMLCQHAQVHGDRDGDSSIGCYVVLISQISVHV